MDTYGSIKKKIKPRYWQEDDTISTASKCGWNGTITGFAGEITKWEFTEEQAAIDATSMSSLGWKEYIACLKSGSGSFTSQTPCGGVGAHASVVFTNDLASYTANIIVTNISVKAPVDGKITFDYTFVVTGEIE